MTKKLLVGAGTAVVALYALYTWDQKVHQHMPCPLCGRNFAWNKPADEEKFSAHLTEKHGIPESQQATV